MVDYTNRDTARSGAASQATTYDEGLRAYMLRVYNNMALGVAVTGLVAWFVANTPVLLNALFGNQIMAFAVMFAPLIFVFIYSARLEKMSESGARIGFFAFSAVMGLSLATIFLAYTGASIAKVFFITSGMFGAMSLYGYTTKKDLSGWGSFLFMGLIGLILASVVNIFLGSTALEFAISVIGVLIFTGLTAYDTQNIKQTYHVVGADQLGKASIIGSLKLYLDFINLFIMLLRLLGDRR